jgi:iron complex outermembrane receptor protein
MKKIIFALILGFSSLLSAQNTVTGIVSDLQNKPLPGVSVYAPELHKGTTTDENGKYEFTNLPNGSFRVAFTFVGFTTQNKTIAKLLKENTLDVTLSESVFEMDEVVVSTPFNKLQSQNVMKVEHESIKTLQQKGTSTLIEGLATIPGVSQISTGTSNGKTVFRFLSVNRFLFYPKYFRI